MPGDTAIMAVVIVQHFPGVINAAVLQWLHMHAAHLWIKARRQNCLVAALAHSISQLKGRIKITLQNLFIYNLGTKY